MSAMEIIDDYKNYVKLAQINTTYHRKFHKNFVQCLIEKQDDINYQIPTNDYLQKYKPELVDSTALHLAFSTDNFEKFNLLLENHADCNVKNHKKVNVVQRAIEENFNKREVLRVRNRFKEYSNNDFTADDVNGFVVMKRIVEGDNFWKHDNWRLWGKIEDRYLNSILSNCLKIKDFANYSDEDKMLYLQAACLTNNVEAIDFIVKSRVNLQQTSSISIFNGFSALHFAAKYSSVEIVKTLMENSPSASFINDKFMSPIEMLINQNLKIIEWLHEKNQLPYKNAINDYVENEQKINLMIIMNSGDKNLSDFHLSCLLTNTVTVNMIYALNDPLKLDEVFKNDNLISYAIWNGNTALHFASYFNIETAKILITKGADIEAKNKNGVTPLYILETRATIEDLHFIVSQKESWKSITLSDGKTKLTDLILSMKNLSDFENFLNAIDVNLSIHNDSPLWPGYSILHLVVTFSETSKKVSFLQSISADDRSNLNMEYENCCREQEKNYRDRIELCLRKNAKVTARDAQGRTPINLAFRQRKLEAVNIMLQHHDSNVNSTDNDNLSDLHIACFVNNQNLVEKLLSNGANVNVAIKSTFKWQCNYYGSTSTAVFDIIGSTPLHLSISSSNLDLVKLLLKHKADINSKDTQGLSSIHRIFILQQLWEAANILYDDRNHQRFFFDRKGNDLPGYSSSLQAANEICKELLSSSELKESIVDDFGLSHYHIAAYLNKVDVVKKLLDEGSDINSVIKSTKKLEAKDPLSIFSGYEGCTALQFSRKRYIPEVQKFLFECGTDVLIKQADGKNSFFAKLQESYPKNIEFIINMLKENEKFRKRLQEEFGWTLLHVACQLVDFDLANFAFSIGVDVNLRTKENSPLHPGRTALHILLKNCDKDKSGGNKDDHEKILSALLINGADVMLTDTKGSTSVHVSDYIYGCMRRCYVRSHYTGRILKHIKNFTVNPVNHEGVSVFHIACIKNDIDAVTKFLENGVDVNQPIEYFGDLMAGSTPLHLASDCSKIDVYSEEKKRRPEHIELQLQVIELLLKHGAEINVENAFGDTPLHTVAKGDVPKEPFFDLLVRHGADINARNIRGETPLETLLSSRKVTSQDVQFFLNQGFRLNSFNEITQVGYLYLAMEKCPSVDEISYKGRTAIHNVVSNTGRSQDKDAKAIGYLVDRGCDIDRQDETGMTALHLAARFRNYSGIEGLIIHGANVNIIDSTGRTAFAWTLESESLCDLTDIGGHNHHLVIYSMTRFIYHMKYRGLYLNEINKQSLITAFEDRYVQYENIEEDYEKMSNVKIENTSFTLNDFFSETGAIVYYSKISKEERDALEQFFTKTVNEHKFHHWDYLCKAQYKKALERCELVENARVAMNVVLGFPLPELCYDVVEKFLGNWDLKSLIGAATVEVS